MSFFFSLVCNNAVIMCNTAYHMFLHLTFYLLLFCQFGFGQPNHGTGFSLAHRWHCYNSAFKAAGFDFLSPELHHTSADLSALIH